MNILIANYCNLNCSYCFAKDKIVQKSETQNITLTNLRLVIGFLKRSNNNAFRMLDDEQIKLVV